jgi:protein disulfide-isomerase A1
MVYFQFDEGRNDYDGEFKEDAIKAFIQANQLPLVIEFTQEVSRIANSLKFLK